VQTIIQPAREGLPQRQATHASGTTGPQFIAKDFKEIHPHRRNDPCQNLTLLSANLIGKIDAGNKSIKTSASVFKCRSPLTTRSGWSRTIVPITTMFACTAPSAMSPQRTNSKAATSKSLKSVTAKLAELVERRKQARQSQHQADVSTRCRDTTGHRLCRPSRRDHHGGVHCSASGWPLGEAPSNADHAHCTVPLWALVACFSVNLDEHIFHCFKCGQFRNALDLWTQANQLNSARCRHRTCATANIPLPTCRLCQNREEETVAPNSETCYNVNSP